VVYAVMEQDLSKAEAARTFGISRTSVHTWVNAYRRRGEQGLRSKPRGRPGRCRHAAVVDLRAWLVLRISARTLPELRRVR
jgi:transposase